MNTQVYWWWHDRDTGIIYRDTLLKDYYERL